MQNDNLKFKKKIKFAAAVAISLLVFNYAFVAATPVFADEGDAEETSTEKKEKENLKVYYSEDLGAGGEKVNHVTVCKKTPAYAPLRCSQKLVEANRLYQKQCVDPKDPEKFNDGEIVKGCLKDKKADADAKEAPYPEVDVLDYDNNSNNCKEDPEKVGYYYVPLFAIVPSGMTDDDESKISGTVAAPKNIINKFLPETKEGESGKELKPLYQSTLCGTVDYFDTTIDEKSLSPTTQKVLAKIGSLANALAKKSITDGCNTTINGSKLNEDPSVTCSAMYRITGKTGTDILSKYISALYKWAAGVVGIIAVFTIVYSGIQISISGAGSDIDKAKERIMQSLIGIAILFLSGLILYTINPTFFTGG